MELTFVAAFYALFVIRNSIALEDSNPCPDCKCEVKCSTIQELGGRVATLEKSIIAADKNVSESMDQQHQIRSMQILTLAHDQEIRKMEARLRKLESENSPKMSMLETSASRHDDTKHNREDPAGINAEMEEIQQQLNSITQKINEIDSIKIKDLTVKTNALQKKLEEEEQIRRSLQMRLDEITDFVKGPYSLSTEREKMIERFSMLSHSIADLDIKFNKSVEVMKQEISLVESKIKHFDSSIKTLHEVQDIFNQGLYLNQQGVDGLKVDVLEINVTLSSLRQKIGNMENESQNSPNPGQQQLNGNIAGTTRSSATALQSDMGYGPYSFVEYEKNKEAEAYENERQGPDCFLPSKGGIGHLLVARVTKTGLLPMIYVPNQRIPSGTKLRFGCQNIEGLIAMNVENNEQMKSNFFLRCSNGEWKGGGFPECHWLQDINEDEINKFSRRLYFQHTEAKRCDFSKENVTDDDDCSGYYLCVDGEVERFECKNQLVFNLVSGFCEPPSNVDCQAQRHTHGHVYNHMNIYYKEDQLKELSSLLPTIRIESDMLDKANSLLATGPIGEVVAYPQSSVTFHCMFPLRVHSSQDLIWIAKYFNSSHHRTIRNIRTQWYKRSIRLDSLTENDSGIYSCIGPNGRQKEVQLIVRAITCPPFITEDTNKLEITYKPHPMIKSLAMTTQAFFKCPDGYDKTAIEKAICTVYGYWSKGIQMDPLPRLDSCWKSRSSENLEGQSDGCSPFDQILNRHVMIDPSANKTFYNVGDSIRFQCTGSRFLIGSNSISCETGGHWSSATPPRCVSL